MIKYAFKRISSVDYIIVYKTLYLPLVQKKWGRGSGKWWKVKRIIKYSFIDFLSENKLFYLIDWLID